jgi:hypothetical protein
MTALSQNVDLAVTGGEYRRLPSEISANPYDGSLLTFAAADGQAHELVAGEPFAGVARQRIPTADAATADGSRYIEATGGKFTITVTISGVGQDDVVHRRKVYASDDATFTFTPSGNTLIGEVIGVAASGKAIVVCTTADVASSGYGLTGIEVLADAAATLTTAQLDKLLVITPTTGRTLTLPAAADCAGRVYAFKNLAAQVLTIDGAGAETVDGASTSVLMDAANDTLTIMSDGTKWLSIAGKIA